MPSSSRYTPSARVAPASAGKAEHGRRPPPQPEVAERLGDGCGGIQREIADGVQGRVVPPAAALGPVDKEGMAGLSWARVW